LALIVLLFGGARSGVVAQDSIAEMIARIEGRQAADPSSPTLADVMAKHHVPGVGIAVIKSFDIHWAKGYGIADVESGRPVTTATRFQAASVSKPVFAMAVLKAVQDGRLALDADVNGVLTSWKVPQAAWTTGNPVTPRSLLSHTSGADDGFGFPGYRPGSPLPIIPQIIAGEKPSNVGPVLFTRPPFTAFKYSGGGITVMQLAMMDLFARPFSDIMRAQVLDPLGMRDSTYEQPLPQTLEATAGRAHSAMGTVMDARWHVYPEQAAAGLWTTPSDLARFAIEVQRALRGSGGRVLSQATAREMARPVGVGPFAVGLIVNRRGEGWYVRHPGDNWGFKAIVVLHVLKGYGVVVMVNGDGGWPVINEIEARVARAYGWDSLDKPLPRW
jgi:CubicO group peptidase (beta-lactamase class C family)